MWTEHSVRRYHQASHQPLVRECTTSDNIYSLDDVACPELRRSWNLQFIYALLTINYVTILQNIQPNNFTNAQSDWKPDAY